MKGTYTFLFTVFAFSFVFSQDFCADADTDLIYAYSNVKSAYKSNNLDHLRYYSDKALKSFEKSKLNLKKCGCEAGYNLAYDGVELLANVENQETFEDGRFYVKRAKDIAQKSITALNEFTSEDSATKADELNVSSTKEEISTSISNLEKEKLITKYEEALSLNIKTYNDLLKTYGSSFNLSASNTEKDKLIHKSVEEIKAFYIDNIKYVTNSYLTELNNI